MRTLFLHGFSAFRVLARKIILQLQTRLRLAMDERNPLEEYSNASYNYRTRTIITKLIMNHKFF